MAVLAVIVYHAGFKFAGRDAMRGGFLGVDIFFVISGYLIAGIILREVAAGTFTFSGFYERRARRILPALFTVMAATTPFAMHYLLPDELERYAGSALSSLAFGSNVWFWLEDSYTAGASALKPLLHTWSLSVEEQFYLLFPPLMLVMWRWARGFMLPTFGLLLGASLALSYYQGHSFPEARFFLLPARGWELLAGAVLAKLEFDGWRRPHRRLDKILPMAGALLIAYSIIVIKDDARDPSHLAVLGTVLIIWFARPGEFVTTLLSSRPFVAVGLISYSLYLWHWPIFAFARIKSEVPLGDLDRLLQITLSVVLAIVTFYLIEKPARRRGGFLTSLRFTLATAPVGLALIALPTAFIWTDGLPARFGNISEILSVAKGDLLSQDGEICANRPIDESCEFLVAGASTTLINIGDSHAAALSPGLLSLARRIGLNYISISQSGCPFVLRVRHAKNGNAKTVCNDRLPEWAQFIRSKAPALIVISGRYPLYLSGRLFDNGEGGVEGGDIYTMVPDEESAAAGLGIDQLVAQTIESLLNDGHTVVLVYPVPEVGWNVPRRVVNLVAASSGPVSARNAIRGIDVSTSFSVYRSRSRATREIFDGLGEHQRLLRVYPEKIFCSELTGRCHATDENGLLYHDDDHPSVYGAELIVDAIEQSLREVIKAPVASKALTSPSIP